MLLGGQALSAQGLKLADSIAQATGCALMVETFNARHERGTGVPAVARLPYFREMAVDKLAACKGLVLAGSRLPVAFFGSPALHACIEGRGLLVTAYAAWLARIGDAAVQTLAALEGAGALARRGVPPPPGPRLVRSPRTALVVTVDGALAWWNAVRADPASRPAPPVGPAVTALAPANGKGCSGRSVISSPRSSVLP